MKKIVWLAFALSLGLFSCDKEGPTEVNFDRDALLTNYGENIIVPRYEQLQSATSSLNQAASDFYNDQTTQTYTALKNAFETNYIAWQACSSFEFGPAGMQTLKTIYNTYPTDTTKIVANISSGTYNLGAASNLDAIGLPALDYLIYGVRSNETEILQYFQNNSNARTYLVDLCSQMDQAIATVSSAWMGQYVETFKNANGTDVGSSLGMLINEMNLDFERYIRDGKVGIPLGVRSLGNPQLDKVEAYYSDISLELLEESIINLRDLYTGTSTLQVNGPGLDDYLIAINATHAGESLNDKILNKFDEILGHINSLNGSVGTSIQNNPANVETLYSSMQGLVVYLKVDLPSNLGVLISYQDNDGD